MDEAKQRFVGLIIKSVIAIYGIWLCILVVDLLRCSWMTNDKCEQQRSELRGAAMSAPATLLAWLAESPASMK